MRGTRILPVRRIFGDFLWLGVSQVGVLVARLIGVRLLTELLPASTYGEMGLALAAAALGVNVLALPIIQAAMRQLSDAAAENGIPALRRAANRLLICAWLGFSILAVASWVLLGTNAGVHPLTISAVLTLGALDMFKAFEVGLLNAAHRQPRFALWNALDAWARPLLACAFILYSGASVMSAVSGTIVGALLVIGLFWNRRERGARPVAAPDASRTYTLMLLNVGWPLVPFAFCALFIGIADRFAIGALAGTAAVGIYIAAYGLASAPFLALSTVLVNVFRPRLYSAHSRGDQAHAWKVVRAWLAAVGAAGTIGWVLLWAYRAPLVSLLLAREFSAAAEIVPIVALAYLLQAIEVVFDTFLLSQKRTARLLVAQAAGAIVAAAAYVCLIPDLGYFGAAWGTVFAQATSMVLSIAFTLDAARSRPEVSARP